MRVEKRGRTMNIHRSPARWRAGSTALLAVGAVVVLVVAVVVRPGAGPSTGASPAPSESLGAPASSLPSPPTPGVAVGRVFAALLPSGDFAVAKFGGPSLRLPPGEQILAVSADHVASVLDTGTAGSNLVVREIATGRQIVRVERPEQVGTAVFAGGSLYFAGSMPDGSDSGVSAIDLANLGVRQVIKPTTWSAEWGGTGSRNQLRVSPTVATVGAPACGPAGPGVPKRCFVDVIDVASGTVTRPVADIPLFLWDISDTTLFAVPEELSFVVAYDRNTGERRWQTEPRSFGIDHYPTSDGRTYVVEFIVPGDGEGTPGSWVLAAIDTADGTLRELYRVADGPEGPRTLWPELSDDRFAVIGRVNARLVEAFGNGPPSVSADVVDIATGQVSPAALTIPSPAKP